MNCLPKVLLALWVCGTFMVGWRQACVHGQAESVDAAVLLQLEGETIDVVLNRGEILAHQIVETANLNGEGDGVKLLKTRSKEARRSKSIRLDKVVEIYVRDRPLDVTYDRPRRSLIHDAEKREARESHEREVADRLTAKGHRYWPLMDASDHEAYLKKHRDFVERCKTQMPELNLQTVETEFYIFTTDLSPREVNIYIAYLDEMYRQLCKAFGLSPEKNIWCGKCVVMTFSRPETYYRFEQEIMKTDATGSQGLCHQSSDGTVIFAGYKGDSPYFGHVLVHETTHGFVHRYMSSQRIPSWLNEGISDWMANAVVKGDRGKMRARQSAALAVSRGGIGDLLTTERISGGTYGTACSMVEILISRDRGNQFRQFLVALKEGEDPEEALHNAFGLNYRDLEALYVARIRNMK